MNRPQEKFIDEMHGIKIPDPYRWLENAQDSAVQEWTKSQNEKTYLSLQKGLFNDFSEELVKNFKAITFSSPVPTKGKYFYTERQPNEDQSVLYMKNGLEEKPIKLLDPNGKRDGNTITIDYWYVSTSGKYVVYGISEGGNEMATLYIKDTETNQELPDKIVHCRYSSVRWLPDDSAFFYTRNARPGTVPKNEEHLHTKVYFHKLGDNPDNDQLIFGENRSSNDMISITLSPDGRYLGIQVSTTWTENEIYIFDVATKEIKPVVTGIPAIFSIVFLNNKVVMDTNYRANNYRVLASSYDDMYRHVDEWKEFIPERQYLLQSLRITKSKILIKYLVNACSEACVFDYDGKEVDKIPLPKYSNLGAISTRREEEEFFYGVESLNFPTIIYRYDPQSKVYGEYRRTDNPLDPNDYEIKQEWYESKDGTKIPMFFFHKKGISLDSQNPTILYGYGGFGTNQYPTFMRNWVPWFKHGGIFAIANIRGGGEFGESWHKGGIKDNKQNSFDDFIAAGEYLIANKYTDKAHLGILGGSNGGRSEL